MALFLNTQGISEGVSTLIREAEREIIIIAPYIKTSQNIYNELFNANARGVETTIIYRENNLNSIEQSKLMALDNLNLMHHPNVHAKCYYNGIDLIIASMNMYEYSELNNREMGVLFNKLGDTDEIFEDAIAEINAIINGSQIEKESRETKDEGFIVDIIKPKLEKVEEYCRFLGKQFIHKRFEPIDIGGERGAFYVPICKNYFDKIDIVFNDRVEISINFDEKRLKNLFDKISFDKKELEYYFSGYKVYWNYHKQPVYIYRDRNFKYWSSPSDEETIKLFKNGIDEVISFLRTYF